MGAVKDILGRLKAEALGRVAYRRAERRLTAPACSITFDDVPRSAAKNAVPLLSEYGASATFYVAGGLQPSEGFLTRDEVRGLVEKGHDVGCHTYSHYKLYGGTASDLAEDAARNRVAFATELKIPRARDFSYPFGEVSIGGKRRIGCHYATARSVYEGLNGPGADLLLLRANPIFSGRMQWQHVRRLIDRARDEGCWLVFYTHGVEANPDRWSCTPDDLEGVLHACVEADVPLRSVRSVSEELLPNWPLPANDAAADSASRLARS